MLPRAPALRPEIVDTCRHRNIEVAFERRRRGETGRVRSLGRRTGRAPTNALR